MQSAMRQFCWAAVEFQNDLESVMGSGYRKDWLVLRLFGCRHERERVGDNIILALQPLAVFPDAEGDVVRGM